MFHRYLFLEVFDVAKDRGDGHNLAIAAIARQAVALLEVPVDLQIVPFLDMADIVDRHVVVLAREERYIRESTTLSEHIARRGLPLTLGHDPLLDPKIFARQGVGSACDIFRRKDFQPRTGYRRGKSLRRNLLWSFLAIPVHHVHHVGAAFSVSGARLAKLGPSS